MGNYKKKSFYTFDFETRNSTRDEENSQTSIWLWDICDENLNHIHGFDMDSFLEYIYTLAPCVLYSHNLKFDSSFIIAYLLKHNWTFDPADKLTRDNTFNCLMDDMLNLYSLKMRCKTKNGKRNIELRDSAKKIPGTVERIAKDWKLPILKGSIDYRKYRGPDYKATDEEIAYIHNDTEIIERVLIELYAAGMDKLTSASDSFNAYIKTIGKTNFRYIFPVLPIEIDDFIRKAYFGGVVMVNPKYKDKIVCDVWDYDYNSRYPAVMRNDLLPYGEPKYFKGKPHVTDSFPLFIIHFKACFTLKPGHFPTIQSHNSFLTKLEYITDTGEEMKELYLCSPDYELFITHYDIYDIKYIDGYYFRGSRSLWKYYIDPIYKIKCESTGCKKQRAKILLNSPYGKFAMNPRHENKEPTLNDDNSIKWKTYKMEIVDPIYTAQSAFITSWGHYYIFTDIHKNPDTFVYCDTDSIHNIGPANNLYLHETKLGALKIENHFKIAKYIGAKAYYGILDNGEPLIKCAGLPDSAKDGITIESFHVGATFNGKLRSKRVDGGTILVESTYTIKSR